MILDNVKRRLKALATLLDSANTPGISTTIKSCYLRSAMNIACTIAEGLVFEIVKRHTNATGNIVGDRTEHIEHATIGRSGLSAGNLFICEKIRKDTLITDNGVDFNYLNKFLKRKNIVTETQFKKLDWLRKQRNKIHLQTLTSKDTGYTKQKINQVADAVLFLLRILKTYP